MKTDIAQQDGGEGGMRGARVRNFGKAEKTVRGRMTHGKFGGLIQKKKRL